MHNNWISTDSDSRARAVLPCVKWVAWEQSNDSNMLFLLVLESPGLRAEMRKAQCCGRREEKGRVEDFVCCLQEGKTLLWDSWDGDCRMASCCGISAFSVRKETPSAVGEES